jgi:hypothetical protein
LHEASVLQVSCLAEELLTLPPETLERGEDARLNRLTVEGRIGLVSLLLHAA